jgi:glycosyltransferase involved in cell wall biosynthesis
MRIFILNTYKHWGGGEWWVVTYGKGLQDLGNQVIVGCPGGSETEKRAAAAGLEVFSISIEADIAVGKIPGLVRFFKARRIDVLICNQNKDTKIGGLAGRLAGVPLVLSRQALDVMKRKPDHRFVYTRFVDGILTNTYALKDLYLKYGWFDDRFIEVVHDGIEIPANVADLDLHGQYNLPAEVRIITAAGRLVHQKGFDILIRVAEKAKKARKPWHFLVIGSGKLEKSLAAMVEELNVGDYIRFVGFVRDVYPVLKASDLFVLSSRSESMSSVLREAMAVKTPCVATRVTGVSELIEHGVSGVLVDEVDAQSIYSGIESVFSDESRLTTLAENGYRRVQHDFDIGVKIKQTQDILDKMLHARAKSQDA